MRRPPSIFRRLPPHLSLCLLTAVAGWAQTDSTGGSPQPPDHGGVYVYVDATLARSAEILALSSCLVVSNEVQGTDLTANSLI